ncbi:uncharacterized protein LOC103182061 [Callorhinchus milii]|uniref:Leucine-rich repeat-containing protein 25-like protein n=1 Tax=Callorhinchus milii TaxID=7868 RepID=V9KZV3_CALMI|nr:uncharacterized protein LOC103182061 [Callorhinchus milii]XP_042198671.1 uncharacterized protein LOC103182061 [Callorhinchus milii]|eukprot:gi/632962069/ref/XP_007897106.1/ PREDICTED: leucine-rich repeat-containing protein 25 [Callorhinchus milii]
MWPLLVLFFVLPLEITPSLTCNTTVTVDAKNMVKCPLECLNFYETFMKKRTYLSASNCNISKVVALSTFSSLLRLDLSNNKIKELPQDFLTHFPALQDLNLVGNPLESLPTMRCNMTEIKYNCSCALVKDMLKHCLKTIGHELSFCYNGSNQTLIKDYSKASCGTSLLPVFIGVPLALIALLLGVGTYFLVRFYRSKQGSVQTSPPGNKRQSVSSADPGQQRYVSTENWKDGASGSGSGEAFPAASPGDYENVLIGEMGPVSGKEFRRQVTPDDTYYLESDVPGSDIYLNEQPIYLNYSGPSETPEDDVYIIPDK